MQHPTGFERRLIPGRRNAVLELVRDKLQIQEGLHTFAAGEGERPGGFGPGGRQLEGEERAAEALEADPFSGLLQGNRLTIQVEGVAVRNYYPVAHGLTETVEELKVAGPAGRIAATVMESTR